MTCLCARIIYYTSVILVKIIDFSQFFFHILTLKALKKLNVTDRFSASLIRNIGEIKAKNIL